MKKDKFLVFISIVLSVILSWGIAKDDEPKIKGQIANLDPDALTLTIANTTFWVDTRTKIENNNSVHISFDDLNPGDFVELEYDPAQRNRAGFAYASKIEK